MLNISDSKPKSRLIASRVVKFLLVVCQWVTRAFCRNLIQVNATNVCVKETACLVLALRLGLVLRFGQLWICLIINMEQHYRQVNKGLHRQTKVFVIFVSIEWEFVLIRISGDSRCNRIARVVVVVRQSLLNLDTVIDIV